MNIWKFFDDRAKRLGILDTKLAQGASMCLAVVIIHIFPAILGVNPFWFVVATVLLFIKPVITFFGSAPKS